MPEETNVIALFGRIEDKIEHLTISVNEYKTKTATVQSSHAEKIIQAEEKIKQLFVFHNENTARNTEVLNLIKDNRHAVGNLKSAVDYHESSLNELETEVKTSLHDLNLSMTSLNSKLEKNVREDEAERNQQIGKGQWVKAFGTGIAVMAGIATVVAGIWQVYKG